MNVLLVFNLLALLVALLFLRRLHLQNRLLRIKLRTAEFQAENRLHAFSEEIRKTRFGKAHT